MSPRKVYLLFFAAAGVLVAGTVLAAVMVPNALPLFAFGGQGCRLQGGPELPEVAPGSDTVGAERQHRGWAATRTLTYALPAAGEAVLRACVGTGKVEVVAGSVSQVLVEAKVRAHGDTEAEAREVAARHTPSVRGRAGAIDADESPWASGSHRGRGVGLTLRVTVPATMALDARLSADTGTVVVSGARLRGLQADTDTGKIQLDPSWAEGRLHVSTDTGAVEARFPGLGSATLFASTDTGSIRVRVPATDRHGYDITASVDTGQVALDLPGLRDEGTPSRSHRHAVTEGYASREAKVAMHLRTDTGNVAVEAA